MNARLFLVLSFLILFSPSQLGSELMLKNFMVVWNVGQGQWATLKDQHGCHHFDMGGERNPRRKVAKLCNSVQNFIYLSHWDWDHISFVGNSARSLFKSCLMLGPLGTSSPRKMRDVSTLEKCQVRPHEKYPVRPHEEYKVHPHEILSLTDFSKHLPKNSNDASHVVLAKGSFLIPGDSGKSQEKRWSRSPLLARAKWLLLGHHGSRTSTSAELLGQLPRLQIAVASARSRRYGHPHVEVLAQLRRHHIPLLRTEDWGHLWFELPQNREL